MTKKAALFKFNHIINTCKLQPTIEESDAGYIVKLPMPGFEIKGKELEEVGLKTLAEYKRRCQDAIWN